MKKVAVFGNAGGGKSTLSKKLAQITGLPLHILDKVQYRWRSLSEGESRGVAVPAEEYKRIHAQILATDRWIIDGFGCIETLWPRLDAADSLVFVDLPLYLHFWWVTKRMLTGGLKPPIGWPENSPILKSSMNSYRVLWLCDKYLTPKYREYIENAQSIKNVYHLRSSQQIEQFLISIDKAMLPKKITSDEKN
jgi:adenylate kinase family enzyme